MYIYICIHIYMYIYMYINVLHVCRSAISLYIYIQRVCAAAGQEACICILHVCISFSLAILHRNLCRSLFLSLNIYMTIYIYMYV